MAKLGPEVNAALNVPLI